MKGLKVVLLAVVGGGVVGGVLWLRRDVTPSKVPATAPGADQASASAPAPRASACSFTKGAQFAKTVTTRVEHRLDDKLKGMVSSSDARPLSWASELHFEVLTDDGTSAVLLGRFAETSALERADLSAPWLVRINADCSLAGFARAKSSPTAAARLQQRRTTSRSSASCTAPASTFFGARGGWGGVCACVPRISRSEAFPQN